MPRRFDEKGLALLVIPLLFGGVLIWVGHLLGTPIVNLDVRLDEVSVGTGTVEDF